MAKNVFSQKQILCPSCRKKIRLIYPNPKLYAASSREEDQRVTGYTWVAGYRSDVLPHHYSVLQCPHCFYATFREEMERPGHNPKEREVIAALEQLPEIRLSFLKQLRELVPAEQLDARGAWAMHLAAIYLTLLPGTPEMIQHLKLGRLYLRLCWLYKELQGDDAQSSGDATHIKSSSSELYSLVEKVDESFEELEELLEKISELAEKRTEELNLNNDDNPFEKYISSIQDQTERSHQLLSQLEHVVQQDRSRILVVAGNGETEPDQPEEGPDIKAIMQILVSLWPQMPQTELSARKLAVEAFDYSYKNEGVGQDLMQGLAVGNLLIQLFSDIGNLERSLEYSLQLYKSCFKDKQSLQMNLNQLQKDDNANPEEVKELNRMLGLVASTLSSAGDSRKILLSRIYERDKGKIGKILKANASASPSQMEKALASGGISAEMITWLKEKQIIKPDTSKKKKWFG